MIFNYNDPNIGLITIGLYPKDKVFNWVVLVLNINDNLCKALDTYHINNNRIIQWERVVLDAPFNLIDKEKIEKFIERCLNNKIFW